MRISDWSSDVCSSDLPHQALPHTRPKNKPAGERDHSASPTVQSAWLWQYHLYAADAHWTTKLPRGFVSAPGLIPAKNRSEESRVGKECGSTCRYRRSPIT